MGQVTHVQAVKVLPWGEEVHMEIPLHKKSANKFYARHGRTSEGRDYIEFSKFGPKPNTENETYSQKLRIFSPVQWAQLKHYAEGELAKSVGWDMKSGQKEFEDSLKEVEEPQKKKRAPRSRRDTAPLALGQEPGGSCPEDVATEGTARCWGGGLVSELEAGRQLLEPSHR